ncbi:unnamed protein product [Ectocarpus sp. 12 AP-2014]
MRRLLLRARASARSAGPCGRPFSTAWLGPTSGSQRRKTLARTAAGHRRPALATQQSEAAAAAAAAAVDVKRTEPRVRRCRRVPRTGPRTVPERSSRSGFEQPSAEHRSREQPMTAANRT